MCRTESEFFLICLLSVPIREYALMRVKDAFRENRNVTDPAAVKSLKVEGYKNLSIIKRQVIRRIHSSSHVI